jgi:hypothetical protein
MPWIVIQPTSRNTAGIRGYPKLTTGSFSERTVI